MLLTINLSETETRTYNSSEQLIGARRLAAKAGRRFAQIVASDGRILDVVEVRY